MFFESRGPEKIREQSCRRVVKGRNQVKRERSLAPSILKLIAICSLALLPEFAEAQDCFIRLYGNMNVNYLEVTVDTRGIGSNEVLEKVSFDVTVNVKGTDKKASFDFTDDDHRSLSAGQVYQRYVAPFPSGIGLQAWTVAANCEYSRVLSWAKSDTGSVNRRDRQPIRKGHPPEPSRVLGKVPPQFWP